tara:strand:+ start:1303 stop:1476 length:174 start_codon:yes stop_codon:yes gene_type:complete
MAGWQSGYAAACKAVYAGSIPASASIIYFKNKALLNCRNVYNTHLKLKLLILLMGEE